MKISYICWNYFPLDMHFLTKPLQTEKIKKKIHNSLSNDNTNAVVHLTTEYETACTWLKSE